MGGAVIGWKSASGDQGCFTKSHDPVTFGLVTAVAQIFENQQQPVTGKYSVIQRLDNYVVL